VGAPAVRAIASHPRLELAGLVVHSAAKEGRDAGELVGIAPTGVLATRDAGAVLAAKPDALVYSVNQDFRPRESQAEMLRALEAGVNVVTPGTYALLHPPSAEPALRARFEAACLRGGSRFLCSGIDPGFAMDLLPVVLSGVCGEIREIRVLENFNYATYEVPEAARAIIGFGSSMRATPPMLRPGVPTGVWGGAIRALAAALDLELERIDEVIERHPLERRVLLADGSALEAGTQGAFRFEVRGIAHGRPALVVEHITRIVDDTAPHWPRAAGMGHHQVRIAGRPDLVLTLECTDERGDRVAGGNAAAAARLVNAIPALCAAPPGLVSGFELPLVAGRLLG
jgi:hypothetical protein